MLKSSIKRALGLLGYRIVRIKEQDQFSAMQRLTSASPNPIIFDVGAHHGYLSLHFRSAFPGATVYAFEPFPESFERLKQNTSGDPRIKAFNFGFCDGEGTKLLSANANSATNSIFETDERGHEVWGTGMLETIRRVPSAFSTIDLFMAKMGIPSVDILKLDVQGAEYLVLKGAAQSLAASRIKMIYTEIIIQPAYRDQKRFHEVLQIIHEYGFELRDFYDPSYTADGKLRQVDAIFTPAAEGQRKPAEVRRLGSRS
jgi:FkbM family methyltransferase